MAKEIELLSDYRSERIATAAADLVAGQVVEGTNMIGFTLIDVTSGDEYALITKADKVRAAKTTGEAWTIDEPVYFVTATNKLTTTAGTNTLVGFVLEAAASAAEYGITSFDGLAAFLKA